jgi:hypothetical protein
MTGQPVGRSSVWDKPHFWDRNGKPLHRRVWGWLGEQDSYRQVARGLIFSATDPSRFYCVSTIWGGMSDTIVGFALMHSNPDVIPPLFRTAIIRPHGPNTDHTSLTGFELVEEEESSWREADARRLHDETVQRVAGWLDEPIIAHRPVVPARPRDGWTIEQATHQELRHG